MPSNSSTSSVQPLPHNTTLQNGHYILEKVLGRGGSGITYRAIDSVLQRPVAIKEFVPSGSTRNGRHLISSGTPVSQTNKEQFLDEARTLAKFQHRNIVKVILAFEENSTVYLVMEYLDGRSLQSLVESQGKLALDTAIAYLTPIAEALGVVHSANLVHRDIKPGNIMLCNDARVVLIDFGLKEWIIPRDKYQTQLLTAATCFGTPGYAPPEQYSRHGDIGIQTDVYALGATFYFLLTGQAPVAALERVMGTDLVPPRQIVPSLSSQVNSAILKSLELPKEKRYPTPKHFLNDLKAPGKQTPPGVNESRIRTQPSPSRVPQTRKTVTATAHRTALAVNCPYCQRVNTLPNVPNTTFFLECFSCHKEFQVNYVHAISINNPAPLDSSSEKVGNILFQIIAVTLQIAAAFFVAAILNVAVYILVETALPGITLPDSPLLLFFLIICIFLVIRRIKVRTA